MDYMAVALLQTLESVKSDLAKDTIQAWKWHGMSDQIFREIEHWLVHTGLEQPVQFWNAHVPY
jgi:hypothetical protein